MSNFVLQVVSGELAGKQVYLDAPVVLGRGFDCQIRFTGSESDLVSGRHAEVVREARTCVLRDLGSTNGTYVNGRRVEEYPIQPGDIISLGKGGPRILFAVEAEAVAQTIVMRVRGSRQKGQIRESTEMLPGQVPGANPTPPAALEVVSLWAPEGDAPRRAGPPAAESQPAMNNAAPGLKVGPVAPSFEPEPENYTIVLARRLKVDQVDDQELEALIKDSKRVERLVGTGILSARDAQFINSASQTYSKSYRKSILITCAILAIALVSIGGLAWQNFRYRHELQRQAQLYTSIQTLERQLNDEKVVTDRHGEQEKMALVARLRDAERDLMDMREHIKAQDRIRTYKNPLGMEIQTILEGFGKQNYLVPDLFIEQVERHIQGFTRTSSRAILVQSFANKPLYKDMIESELRKAGMPVAFLYLAMHESKLDPLIPSGTGARGLWQLTGTTARELGLKVPRNWEELPPDKDERTNPELSTRAGVKYLKGLLAEFGDVALAMAAYNAGGGKIRSALRQIEDPINHRDFWFLYRMGILTDETNEYVPRIIATMIIDKNRARYGFAP